MKMYTQDSERGGLLRKNAQEIALSIASAINCDVLITDIQGIVAGTSAASRLGTLHEPALQAIASGQPVETGAEDARSVKGGATGVTAPIQSMNGQTVGAMAILGAPEKVRLFTVIVRQQIETLLRERELYAYSVNRESTLQNLIQDIGSFVPGVSSETLLLSRAQEYGYDRSWHYIPIAVDLYQFGRFALQVREQMRGQSENAETRILNVKKAVLASIRKIFSEPRDLSAMLGNNRFVILFAAAKQENAHAVESEMIAAAQSRAQKILGELKALELKAAIGIGSPASGMYELAGSYQEAWKALFIGKKFKQQPGVYNIMDYRLEDVITTIDASVRNRFVQAVTGKFRRYPDWEQMRESIRQWCESGFSLVEAARRLHVHRNTLIYRLDKLDKESGLNLKDFRTCLNLYLALVMDQYVGPAVQEKDL